MIALGRVNDALISVGVGLLNSMLRDVLPPAAPDPDGPLMAQARAWADRGLRFERDLIRERTMAGLTAARARGRTGGRPKGVDEKKRKAVLALQRDPQYTVKAICELVGISRNTYYKYTREAPEST